jgi:diguanylate cyclase (GGDEF)-like protein
VGKFRSILFGANPSLVNARRDAIVLGTLIAAVFLLIWNGSAFFHQLSVTQAFGPGLQVASTALTLNVALILFGWRRYVDLQHEAEKRAEGEMRAAIAASTDAVTGLLNRKGFADRAEGLWGRARESDRRLLLISLQVNRLKPTIDRYGYEAGDALLRSIAESVSGLTGEDALAARLGGDEFVVAMALPVERLEDGYFKAEELLHQVARPYEVEGKMLQVGGFAGIASATADEAGVPDLLRRADIALEHAKTGRTARPVWFDAAMERALVTHSEIEQGIRFGLEQEQFVAFFEPQVDLKTTEIIGFEVLARWMHPLSGIIPPDVFLPVAEEIGVMNRLSEQVIRAALIQAGNWDPAIKISVNISPSQLADGWLAERILMLLTETRFPAERLLVEITESALFSDLDLARSMVLSLKNQGVRVALDDFGTGYSSLSHLRSLPFDLIKIDRSFVTNIHQSAESEAIVRAVVTLADALKVPILVEGIESEAVHATVLGLGCSNGQGWYFGKPVNGEQATQLLARRSLPQLAQSGVVPQPVQRRSRAVR